MPHTLLSRRLVGRRCWPRDKFNRMFRSPLRADARRSPLGMICVLLVLVPFICAPGILTAAEHDGAAGHQSSADHHMDGMNGEHHMGSERRADHAAVGELQDPHGAAVGQVETPHHAHGCCAVAAQLPTREDELLPQEAIGAFMAVAQRAEATTSVPGLQHRARVNDPSGTPGLAATSVPLRR